MRREKKACCSAGGAEHLRSDRRIRGRDLLFCFSSRPSEAASSSASAAAAMRAPSSKSILSPGRSRAASAGQSLSSSLSRRLRSRGSVKGGQSPMFPAVGGGRRKGVAFEAAEPSSPKVTCIGQVRVKSKKKKAAAAAAAAAAAKGKGVALRSRSMRGEASFRRTEGIGGMLECLPRRNQRWAYQLPESICEALRAIGSEFNCFFPCGGRSMCIPSRSGEGKEGEKRSNSCGAVLARWLMVVPDSNDGKRREMVKVVVDDRKERKGAMLVKESVDGEDLELQLEKSEEVVMVLEKGQHKEEEEARVSICIPPKNALLLMRCRSDPVRMAALASRFCESPVIQVSVDEGDGEEEEDGVYGKLEGEKRDFEVATEEQKSNEDEGIQISDQGAILIATEETMQQLIPDELNPSKDEDLLRSQDGQEASADEERADLEVMDKKAPLEDKKVEEKEDDKGKRSSSYSSTTEKEQRRSNRHSSRSKDAGRRRSSGSRERDRRRHSFSTVREVGRSSFGSGKEASRASFSVEAKGKWNFCIEKDHLRLEKAEVEQDNTIKEETADKVVARNSPCMEKEDLGEVIDQDREERLVELEAGEAGEKKETEKKSARLPDCLLLMMYEPKLSMEVSKETWVCSNDFLQWRLHHPNYHRRHPSKASAAVAMTTASASSNNAKDEVENKEPVTSIPVIPHPPPPPPQPAPPTAPEAEEKSRGNAGAALTPVPPSVYGPLALTRCKSEPTRSSAKLTPDACFWKDRHRPIGATGIGF